MANGQQKAQQNAAAFQAWSATQSEDDFKQIIFQGQLNRGEIAKAVGCGKSALSQNPELRKHLRRVRISTLHNETEKISLLNSNTYKGAFLCLVTYSHLP